MVFETPIPHPDLHIQAALGRATPCGALLRHAAACWGHRHRRERRLNPEGA